MIGKTYVNDMGAKHVVSDNKDGFVYFTNGARIKQELFSFRFQEVPTIETDTTNVNNNPIYQAIMNGKVGEIEEDNEVYVSGISDETKRLIEQAQQITRIEAPRTDDGGVVPVEERLGINQNTGVITTPTVQVQTETPEQLMLKRFKRVHQIDLNFSISESIPEPESLKVIDNLFEKSMIELLAEEIATKLANDKTILIEVITNALRDKIYPKSKAKPKAKPKPKSKPKNVKTIKPSKTTTD